ncbi:MAG: endonuclease MutS2 [Limnochordales bacterium]|nr:endonuclease MutS2 [Limnochordales bacterium]
MNEQTLRVLEWPKVRELLACQASWSGGKQLALSLLPSADPRQVERALDETGEALAWLDRGESLPLGGVTDISTLVARARAGGILDPGELLRVADFCQAVRRCRQFLLERAAVLPRLAQWIEELSDMSDLEKEIARCVDEQIGIRDSASPKLAALRRQVRSEQNRAREHLENLVRSAARYLQEPIITLRNGRFVLPVKAECRADVPGIVHDQSGSGATLFIEPLAVIEINNRVRELESRVREEEERILRELTGMVGASAPRLEAALTALAYLDLAEAKARLAAAMHAVRPRLVDGGIVELEAVRHPLLRGEVVPIDLRVGRDFQALVITGPNTGGKTVSIKTGGLAVLMAQSGLFVPARRAEISIFRKVFADIGDEQSIEQNLSTFSGHLRVIRDILEEADDATLVILDELGAGTDPVEGSTLAQAILEQLLARGSRILATTHLSTLKLFAHEHPQVANAAVSFDLDTLRPTYQLVIGIPGRSMALAIARRLGLPAEVVARAEELLGEVGVRLEDVVSGLESERRQAAEERREVERLRAELAALRSRQEEELRRLAALRREVQEKARRRVEEAVHRALLELNQMVGEARQRQRQGTAEEALAAAQRAREQVRQLARRVADTVSGLVPDLAEDDHPAQEAADTVAYLNAGVQRWTPRPGEQVRLRNGGQRGEIRSVDPDGTIEVQVGVFRLRVEAYELEPIPAQEELSAEKAEERAGARTSAAPSSLAGAVRRSISVELDLRGERVEEACAKLDKYLDQAVLAGLPWVRVIHGKGTGMLRQAVQQYLQKDPRVTRFRLGEPGEGGSGVTIAWLS